MWPGHSVFAGGHEHLRHGFHDFTANGAMHADEGRINAQLVDFDGIVICNHPAGKVPELPGTLVIRWAR